MRDGGFLYLIVWLGAGLRRARESLERQWRSVLRSSLGKVIEMLQLRFSRIYRASSPRSAAKVAGESARARTNVSPL